MQPIAPEPDAKDWTWVVEHPCGGCGFEAGAVDPRDVAGLLRENLRDWEAILTGAEELVRARPEPATWSAAEYGAHVRDVFTVYDERLVQMLTQDGPHYANWDQDATAIEERYDLQDPADILADLLIEGRRLADRFDTVGTDQWTRLGHRSDGATFTIRTFAQYFIHDPVHHVHDARTGMAGLVR